MNLENFNSEMQKRLDDLKPKNGVEGGPLLTNS